MDFLKLYDEENRVILYSMSWLNKNSIFDKSIGSFKEIDLFTFLENVNEFDYNKDIFYDDIYYILEYTLDNIIHLINNINKEIKREHKIIPISQAKEFDKKTILWLSRQDGRTIKEKLKNNKIKAVKRYKNVDTYENRIFKIFLKKLVLIFEARQDIQNNDYILHKIRQWLRSEDAKNINEYGNIVYNNILLHHPHYSKIFKGYKWLNRLDEKVDYLVRKYPAQIRTILRFEIFTQLQFLSAEYILPNNLDIDLNTFNIKEDSLLINHNIDNIIRKINNNVIQEKLPFNSIRNFSKYLIEKQLNIKEIKDRSFYINDRQNEVYIDLFRLFPIARIDNEILNFPITLKQKIGNKIINASNTKIINLDHEIHTLPEILKTYDTSILRYFLEDLKKSFKDQQLNYIIPDYVNIFEFSQVKKSINSYFPYNRNIPKSILAGMKYILDKNIKFDDTLIYIQKNHNNELFITPLLVKYDKKLESITEGLYIERHPTKKLQDSNDILNSLNNIFPKDISQKLLNKFLQNGLKSLKKEKIVFYHNEDILKLNDLDILKSQYDNTSIDKVKKLYTTNSLFKKKTVLINDDKVENLKIYKIILGFESDGFTVWREHLPDLSMEIIRDGYFDEFILVDERTQIIDKKIEIKGHFTIPKGISELSFPLVFDNKKIGYIADLKSKDFPFSENIECTLELIYDYESEELYKLNFIPVDDDYLRIKVEWKKEKENKYKKLIYPEYPSSFVLEDDIEDNIIKELNRLQIRLDLIEKGRGNENTYLFLSSSYSKALFSRYWQDGNSIMNSQNGELKQLIFDIINKFTKLSDKLPYDFRNNIYLFLSYIHQDLIINPKTDFIIKEFMKLEHLYGISLGCLNTKWQDELFGNIFSMIYEKQIIILNIAFWRCEKIIRIINQDKTLILLNYLNKELLNKYKDNERNIITYLEFILALLRTKGIDNNKILHPNENITRILLETIKNRSKYFLENYDLKSKISFGKIDKPENLQQMPDLLYAVIYYLSNEDIENKIIINEVKS